MSKPSYCKGDAVSVFYRMDARCERGRKYVAVLDPHHGAYRPRTGLSEGWIPACVAVDYDEQKRCGEVCIEYSWPHFFTQRGHLVDTRAAWTEWFPLEHVRKAPSAAVELRSGRLEDRPLVEPGSPAPELAILSFRWGGVQEIRPCEQWGHTGSPVADVFFRSFVETAVIPKLGSRYEVWTVYLEDRSDMMKVADMAHLVFGRQHPARRAKNCCAMYFLYPTCFEENCIPTSQTGGDGGAGLVDQQSLFRMMKAVERAGVVTRFPHCSGLYEQLASKRWTHQMALTPHLRVPPTVALPRMLIERSCEEAATKALASLRQVREEQARLRGEVASAPCEGVAKLGFSWEALDVKYWKGEQGLQEALYQLTQAIEISQELTGQPHDCESLLVQDFVDHDLELRVYTVEGKIEGNIYTRFCSVKDNNEFGDFQQDFSKENAAKRWMGGDVAALDEGERLCRDLTARWLAWVQAQACEMPCALRFDYFVKRGKTPGTAAVWTLEICELGFSMLCEKNLPGKVFEAMLRTCLDASTSDATGQGISEPKRRRCN